MIDLYLIVTPAFGLLSLLTLINLKFALLEPKTQDLHKYEKKVLKKQQNQTAKQTSNSGMQPGYKNTVLYFIKNFTIAEFCFIRRSRSRIPFLFSISLVAILTILTKIQLFLAGIGLVITLLFFLCKILTEPAEQKNQQKIEKAEKVKIQDKFEQKLQVILTCLSLFLNMGYIWLVYKNYNNSTILSAIQNFLITIALDNFAVKPIFFLILSIPIQNIEALHKFIRKQNEIVSILHEERILKAKFRLNISVIQPKKNQKSPTKVPKAIQIQPHVHLDNVIPEYHHTTDLLKNSRRLKTYATSHKKSEPNGDKQSSLITLFNTQYNKRFQNQCIQDFFNISPKNKQLNNDIKYSSICRRNKLYTENNLEKNQSNKDIDNQEQQDLKNNSFKWDENRQNYSNYKKGIRYSKTLRTSAQKSFQSENSDKQNAQSHLDDSIIYRNKSKAFETLEDENSNVFHGQIFSSAKKDLGKIKQDKIAEDLGQIDMNSPERRKNQTKLGNLLLINEDKLKVNAKSVHKKYSLDPNRHVIKHSTGQPYLQFLPSLLNKEREQKLSSYQKRRSSFQRSSHQIYSRKVDITNGFGNQSKFSRSLKRTRNTKDPIVRQNDQNRIPEFVIEDFY